MHMSCPVIVALRQQFEFLKRHVNAVNDSKRSEITQNVSCRVRLRRPEATSQCEDPSGEMIFVVTSTWKYLSRVVGKRKGQRAGTSVALPQQMPQTLKKTWNARYPLQDARLCA